MRVDIFIKEIGQVEEALLKNATRKEVKIFFILILKEIYRISIKKIDFKMQQQKLI